jgi:phenylpyruvate tautomerase PptA (4-oxalocrotonate tautomerase family)
LKGIKTVFINLGIPLEAVNIVIHENELDNWPIAGELHSSRFKKSE